MESLIAAAAIVSKDNTLKGETELHSNKVLAFERNNKIVILDRAPMREVSSLETHYQS